MEYIVDSAEKKIGSEFCGKIVCAYEKISEKIDVIIVTNPYFIKEIMKKVNNPKKIILNIYPFVEYGCDIEMVVQPCGDCEET